MAPRVTGKFLFPLVVKYNKIAIDWGIKSFAIGEGAMCVLFARERGGYASDPRSCPPKQAHAFSLCVIAASLAVAPSVAQAEDAWSVDQVDMNTVVVSGKAPGIEDIAATADHPGIFLFPNQDSIVLRGSPAMTDNRERTLSKSDEPTGMIVGGSAKAQPGQFASQVALIDTSYSNPYLGQFCGGVILDSNWVLTAAHCVYQANARDSVIPVASFNVVAGVVTLDGAAAQLPVKRVVIHESWKRGDRKIPLDNDVALLEMATPIAWTDYVRPAQLVQLDADAQLLSNGAAVRVSGWGRTEPDDASSHSRDLLWADINVIANEECATAPLYGGALTGNMFCAAQAGGACAGDSGGGVISRETNPVTTVGIVSWAGGACTGPDTPGVFVRLSKYADWIKDNTR
jgi:Trypsin